ncbi:unnamed protein product [Enterobius vermicularis]|uniref:Endoplasmic reticulum transmembrane protein n=1 Tax=Enterobius vermicularis TaxID=51028 RepID=A0A0N4UTC2_ENTVE|nr:unnamed protein product [Enterobius vermicularis]
MKALYHQVDEKYNKALKRLRVLEAEVAKRDSSSDSEGRLCRELKDLKVENKQLRLLKDMKEKSDKKLRKAEARAIKSEKSFERLQGEFDQLQEAYKKSLSSLSDVKAELEKCMREHSDKEEMLNCELEDLEKGNEEDFVKGAANDHNFSDSQGIDVYVEGSSYKCCIS